MSFRWACRRQSLPPPVEPAPLGLKSPTTWLVISAIVVAFAALSLLIYHSVSDKGPRPPSQVQLPKQLRMSSGDMVLVGAGPARLGTDNRVVSVKAFYIDRTEVSNRAYARFLREKARRRPKDFAEDKPDYPVVNVSLYDAMEFAKWAGKRLPTKDEWEKAARGPNGQLYPWGNEPKPELANIHRIIRAIRKHGLMPVAAFPAGASPYGALNMCGNVWEWVDADQPPNPDFLKQMQRHLNPR